MYVTVCMYGMFSQIKKYKLKYVQKCFLTIYINKK